MAAEIQSVQTINAREGRSPNYPYLNLKEAVARAIALRKGITKNEARIATAGEVWQLGTKSSGLRSMIAALKQFGLIDYIGSGADRKIKLTESAHRIVLDDRPDSAERGSLIQKAALLPNAHKLLWNKWQADLPPDVEVIAQLTLDEGFSKSGALEFLDEYKETLAFAKLIGEDKKPDEESDILEQQTSQQPERSKVAPIQPPRQTQAAINERITYKPGQEIALGFGAEPDVEMYEFLKDYLDFRIAQMKKQKPA